MAKPRHSKDVRASEGTAAKRAATEAEEPGSREGGEERLSGGGAMEGREEARRWGEKEEPPCTQPSTGQRWDNLGIQKNVDRNTFKYI